MRQKPFTVPDGKRLMIRGRPYVVTADKRVFVLFETGHYACGSEREPTPTGRELKNDGPTRRDVLAVAESVEKINQCWHDVEREEFARALGIGS